MSEGEPSDAAKKAVEDKPKKYWSKEDDPSQAYNKAKSNTGGSDHMIKLQMKKETVNLANVGLINVSHPKNMPLALIEACKRYGVAQAVLDNISNSEDMLAIRNIFPDLDFVNSARERITKREWVQPRQVVDSRWGGYWSTYDGDDERDHEIYVYTKASRNDRKVLIIYGIKNLKYQQWPILDGISANAAASKAEINCTSAKVTRAGIKIIDIPDLSLINDTGVIWFDTPFLFKRADELVFYLRPKLESRNKSDNLMLLGMVIEALGSTMTG